MLKNIVGCDFPKKILASAVISGNHAGAYLFFGPRGVGKTLTALEFAKALNCESPVEGGSCDTCASCRSIDHGNSPDVTLWSPEGQNTKIEQMRHMREEAWHAPLRAKFKVNIIEKADTMNEESSNSVLKLLEEPPDYLVNILLYENTSKILDTIASRCAKIRFTPAPAEEVISFLTETRGADPERASLCALHSGGCPGRALEILDDDRFDEKRAVIADAAESILTRDIHSALIHGERMRSLTDGSQKDSAKEALDMLAVYLRDIYAASLDPENADIVNADQAEEIRFRASRAGNKDLPGVIRQIIETGYALSGNANPQIALESLLTRVISD